MKRRDILISVGAVAGTGAAIGTGAFSSVQANRNLSIALADDANSYLALTPGSENGEYVDTQGGTASLNFTGEGDVNGLGRASIYEFDNTLRVQNQGTQAVYLWVNVSSEAFDDDALYLYLDDATTPVRAEAATELMVGDSVELGVYIDTNGLSGDSFEADVTIQAASNAPTATGGDGEEDSPEPLMPIDSLQFDSTAGLLGVDGPLSAEATVVTAQETATSIDADGNEDAIAYESTDAIPLMAYDSGVFAAGVPFVQNDTNFGEYGNEELFLNLLDEYADGSTVLWDEGHGQFYDLSSSSTVEQYAEANGYTVDATSDLTADLSAAGAIVITSPSDAFSETELSALASFVDDGGLVVLMDQSDFNNFDATDNLNAIATELDLAYRFNDNQIEDPENNTGAAFSPTSDRFNTTDFRPLFSDREGLGLDLSKGETYEVSINSVTDGDTVDVQFDNGSVETVRILGLDTPETGDTDERLAEYEGITDAAALRTKADEASARAADLLADSTVTLSFDENEPLRGNFGRLLGYLELADDRVFNEVMVEEGYARVYASGFADQDRYAELEGAAQQAGSNLWSISDPTTVPESGDSAVSELFFPTPVAVSGGTTVVSSEAGEPLVTLDDDAGVAAIGGPLVDEGFESEEGGSGIEGYGQYPFLTNVIDRLADGGISGPVLFEGGHGQFNADFAIGAEDAAYYQRYLEAQSTPATSSIGVNQTNDVTNDVGPQLLDADGTPVASALIVSTPSSALSADERTVIADFAAAGGAVILLGTAADADALENFADLTSDLGTDVGFTTTAVTDAANNLSGESTPTTTNFASETSELFTAFTPADSSPDPSVPSVTITDVSGSDEYVVLENTGGEAVTLTDWTLTDGADNDFIFPDTTLPAGETLGVLYDGKGESIVDADNYIDALDYNIWNNGGDTATLVTADSETVDSFQY